MTRARSSLTWRVAVALGGDCLADLAAVRAQPEGFGPLASDPTVSRRRVGGRCRRRGRGDPVRSRAGPGAGVDTTPGAVRHAWSPRWWAGDRRPHRHTRECPFGEGR